MALFYIIKELKCSLNRKFSEYEFCCFLLKLLFLTIFVNTEVQKNEFRHKQSNIQKQ